jgi:hypothetical protein
VTLFKKVGKLREYKAGNALLTHLYRFSFEVEYPLPLVEEGGGVNHCLISFTGLSDLLGLVFISVTETLSVI